MGWCRLELSLGDLVPVVLPFYLSPVEFSECSTVKRFLLEFRTPLAVVP